MAQQNPGDEFVSNVKKIPSQVADTVTLGPQRRSVSQSIGDEANKASSFIRGQWDQAKDLLSSPDAGKKAPDPKDPKTAHPNSFKHGGTVQKTGVALVHKGETIIPANQPKTSSEEDVHLSKHRVVMHLNHGGLHRALHIPENETIPKEKIEEGKHSKNPHMREMSTLADNMSHWHKK